VSNQDIETVRLIVRDELENQNTKTKPDNHEIMKKTGEKLGVNIVNCKDCGPMKTREFPFTEDDFDDCSVCGANRVLKSSPHCPYCGVKKN